MRTLTTTGRNMVDLLVQCATVELLHCCGVALAPLSPTTMDASRRRYHNLVGMATFSAPGLTGTLTLSLPDEVFPLLASAGKDPPPVADCIRELTNQLMGRIKNRLMHYQVRLKIGLPSAMNGGALESQRMRSASERTYQFRSLRGDVVVTLDTTLDETPLVYSGAVPILREGDIVLL